MAIPNLPTGKLKWVQVPPSLSHHIIQTEDIEVERTECNYCDLGLPHDVDSWYVSQSGKKRRNGKLLGAVYV
jgi:hypothetical protein